jgi:sugar phosphate isomerase/epimerase
MGWYVNMKPMAKHSPLIAGASPRGILRWLAPAAITFCLLHLPCAVSRADEATTRPTAHVDHKGLVKLGWQLACQGSTFHDRSAFDMLDLLHSLGFHHVELSPQQAPTADLDALAAKLKSVHLDIVSYGVVEFTNDPTEARKVFDLAKKLKAKNIVASPPPDALPMLDGLADQYQIKVAIVNSPKPGPYWDCGAMLQALNGRSERIGVCADITNWRRSGLDPMQCLAKLAGHVIECHLTDVTTDDADMNSALDWFKQQNFRGIFAVESDAGSGDELVNNFIASVNAFSDQVTRLASVGN